MTDPSALYYPKNGRKDVYEKPKEKIMFDTILNFIWSAKGALSALLIYLVCGLFTVEQMKADIIEFLGKFWKVAQPGLNWRPLFLAQRAYTVEFRQMETQKELLIKTLNNASVKLDLIIQWRALPDKAKEVYYELEEDEQVISYALNEIRERAPKLTLDELYNDRNELGKTAVEAVNKEVEKFGFRVTAIQISEPNISDKVRESFDRVVSAEQELVAARKEGEALKVRMVSEAEAEAESLKLKTQAYVSQRKEVVEAFRESMPKLTDQEIMHLLAGIDQRDAIRDASKGPGSIVVLGSGNPADASISSMIAMQRALDRES